MASLSTQPDAVAYICGAFTLPRDVTAAQIEALLGTIGVLPAPCNFAPDEDTIIDQLPDGCRPDDGVPFELIDLSPTITPPAGQ